MLLGKTGWFSWLRSPLATAYVFVADGDHSQDVIATPHTPATEFNLYRTEPKTGNPEFFFELIMKYWKAFIFLAALLLNTTSPAFSQEALGVNYNQFLQSIQEREISQIHATWVRGFLDMHLLGNQDPSQNPDIQAMLEAKAHGRHTILNLKWNYETEPFPTPGSAAMTQEVNQLNRVLPVVLGKVDILVIGNEPFIETLSTKAISH
jgi:hypothetical protein